MEKGAMTTTLQRGIRLCLTGHAPGHCAHISLVFPLYSHPDIPQTENPQLWLLPVLGQAFFPDNTLKFVILDEFIFLGLPRSGDLHRPHQPPNTICTPSLGCKLLHCDWKLATNSLPWYSPQTANHSLNSRSLREISCLRLCMILEISNYIGRNLSSDILPHYSIVFPSF